MKSLLLTVNILVALTAFMVAFSCQARKDTSAIPAVSPPITGEPALSGTEPWREEWQRVINEAKREGPKLTVYTSWSAGVREAIGKAVEKEFGMDIEFIAGRGAENAARIVREKKSDINMVDFIIGGSSDHVMALKPLGYLDPLKPLLFLPEVLDPQKWWQGKLPWVDKEQMYTFAPLGNVGTGLIVNTQLVAEGEIKRYPDMLAPKWKGKIAMADPSVTGPMAGMFTYFNEVLGADFFKKLIEQEPALTRDRRLISEWLARGKYAIGWGIQMEDLVAFWEVGAPLKNILPTDVPIYMSGGAGSISILKAAPHPKTAKLFANWYLSRDGQTVLSRSHVSHSGRVDVSTEGLPQEKVRKPGANYFFTETEEFRIKEHDAIARARELFAPLLK